MLVEGDGWKIWGGTVPLGLDFGGPARGHRIAFTATVEASDDDASFGYFTRPAKARILETPVVVDEDTEAAL